MKTSIRYNNFFRQKEYTMETVKLLHNYLLKSCPNMHSARRKCLLYAVESGLSNQRLTLTSLGRNGSGNIKVKNKIKKIDRLLGNKNLQCARVSRICLWVKVLLWKEQSAPPHSESCAS